MDVAMSPLSTKDEGEIRPAAGEDPALDSIDLSNSLLEVWQPQRHANRERMSDFCLPGGPVIRRNQVGSLLNV